jgi:hypothetical protein
VSSKAKNKKVKVLYQNLGGVWYAFAEGDEGNVYFGRVPLKSKAAKSGAKDSAQTTATATSRSKRNKDAA